REFESRERKGGCCREGKEVESVLLSISAASSSERQPSLFSQFNSPMARALCNASFAAALSDGIAILANRRGYAAAAAAAVTVARSTTVEQKPVKGAVTGATEATTSWVPDPITGCYRPANRSAETDAADLR
ncbi:hypothetical protein ACYTW9_27130, partial [Escherichia coli]